MGRVFVVQADLTKLVVEDVVVPCDSERNVHEGFAALFPATENGTFCDSSFRRPLGCDRIADHLWRMTGTKGQRVWLLDSSTDTLSGMSSDHTADILLDRVVTQLSAIADDTNRLDRDDPRTRRIGVVLMGIKQGGFGRHYAEIIRETLTRFRLLCREKNVDIVLSLRDRADYAAVQHLRRQDEEVTAEWPGAPATVDAARRLAGLAAKGQLVLFIGAGASVGAGLGDWNGLLLSLAAEVELDVASLDGFDALDPRDQALLIASASGATGKDIPSRIAEAFTADRYPLTQALLASLGVEQTLTTNYDVLYETAYNAGGKGRSPLVVVPRQTYQAGHPWLMKIHGDASEPRSIVLSRDDYIRFDADSVPMASVLQSAMLTSHILFVGYSVSDENIVRLARQVVAFRRQAKPPAPVDPKEPTVGTVLVPQHRPAKAKLWEQVLDYVPLPEPGVGAASAAVGSEREGDAGSDRAARIWQARVESVEAFLDLLGMYACQDAPYLMVDRYEALLKQPEVKLKHALRDLQTLVERNPTLTLAQPVRALLEGFGAILPPTSSKSGDGQ